MDLLSILYVAYPLLPVSEESAGGAEQMLSVLERLMAARGHRTTVAACAGSRVAGRLLATGSVPDGADRFDEREAEHSRRILACAASLDCDLVHDKSGSFWRHAAALDCPMLATLHLPRSFYRPELFTDLAPNLFFHCVSVSQAASFADLPRMLGVVENGIEVERFPFTPEKQRYLLWIGRICEEKGVHLAVQVAAQTRMPLVIAGQVYPFSYHRRYYEERIRPHLGGPVRFVEAPSFDQKLQLLRHAEALLAPSLCDETSSLVSLEAMACGTPVIAFRRGALPEIVADGETGRIVDSADEMVAAVGAVARIDSRACRARVERLYSATRMADGYEQMYRRVATAGTRYQVSGKNGMSGI